MHWLPKHSVFLYEASDGSVTKKATSDSIYIIKAKWAFVFTS